MLRAHHKIHFSLSGIALFTLFYSLWSNNLWNYYNNLHLNQMSYMYLRWNVICLYRLLYSTFLPLHLCSLTCSLPLFWSHYCQYCSQNILLVVNTFPSLVLTLPSLDKKVSLLDMEFSHTEDSSQTVVTCSHLRFQKKALFDIS